MRRVLGVIVIVSALVACGGSGSSRASKADAANDQATADAALLRVAELPAGFAEVASSASSSTDSADDSSASQQFDACMSTAVGETGSQLDQGRTAKAKKKYKGSGYTVNPEVEFYADSAQVNKQLDAFRNDATIDCVAAGIRASAAKDPSVTVDDVKVLDRPAAPDGGAAAAIQLTLTSGGRHGTVIESIYIAAKGRAEVTLTVISATANDALFVDSAIQAMIGRLP